MADKEIYCHYRRAWFAMGRARKRCPNCGAVIDGTHQIRDAAPSATRPSEQRKETRHG